MTEPDERAAWRLFSFNWVVIALMALALLGALALTRFSISPRSALVPFGICAAYVAYTYYRAHRPHKRDARVVFTLGSTGQLLIIPVLMTPLTYITAAADRPMQDAVFMAMDHALGLDWMSYFNFVYSHYALLYAAALAYSMIGWPVFGVPIALGLTRRYRRLQEFTLAFSLALVLTTVMAAVWPAIGTYGYLHFVPDPKIYTPGSYLASLHDLPLVRDGTLRHLAFRKLAGIITFPSFHAAAAVLYLWAFWPVRWIGPFALIAMIAMLLATPLCGGHYFIDVFAGIAIAAVSMVIARFVTARLLRAAPETVAWLPAAGVPAE